MWYLDITCVADAFQIAKLPNAMETSDESDSSTTTCSNTTGRLSDFEREKEAEDLINKSIQDQAKQTLNVSLNLVGESPLSLHSIPKRQKPKHAKESLQKESTSFAKATTKNREIT